MFWFSRIHIWFAVKFIFTLAQYPMDLIDHLFGFLGDQMRNHLPDNALTSLFIDGVLAGIRGVAIFLPQILILFAFIAILEDTGYMARVSFMMANCLVDCR